ncbi:glycosyltransferase [Granulosicoccus sp.]|nr:glycosyltransferase [Granulosicoccus sp.]
MKHLPLQTGIVALIATRNRPELLQRALTSIALQAQPPDAVLVVEDIQDSEENAHLYIDVALPHGTELIVLRNRRTRGLSGALNSGIDEITRRVADIESLYIAILDDDDWWEPNHLALCLKATKQKEADMVAAQIVRHDDNRPNGRTLSTVPTLDANLALTQNTGIQGSNVFVRATTLLEAGSFDESLRSTTDRDLVIRLADVGAKFVAIRSSTVHHDARGGRQRLSSPRSLSKITGLQQFWRKYHNRMNSIQQEEFQKRAINLFGADVNEQRPETLDDDNTQAYLIPKAADNATPLHLVVGIVADGDVSGVNRVYRLLKDLQALLPDPRLAALEVVVVENGNGGCALAEMTNELVAEGLDCRLASVATQFQDAADGVFGTNFTRAPGQVGISDARTIVQRYVHIVAPQGSVAWILDDDKQLSPLTLKEGSLSVRAQDTLSYLLTLRDSKADIIFGTDTSAAPLPVYMTLRVQLVDLYANLADFRTAAPDTRWSKCWTDNLEKARIAPKAYYHDLARTPTHHLERPFCFVPNKHRTRTREAFIEFCHRAPRILAGEQVFRPLFVDDDASLTLRPSIRRGGNTLFMDLDALIDVPQYVPVVDGRPSRRSDMVSAILNNSTRRRCTMEASFALNHNRTDLPERTIDINTLVDDVRGFALYSALMDLIDDGTELTVNVNYEQHANRLHSKYLQERTASLVMSLWRANGAAKAALRILSDTSAWWWSDPECNEAAQQVHGFLSRTLQHVAPNHIDSICRAVAQTPADTMDKWLAEVVPRLNYAASFRPERPSWLTTSRVENARNIVEKMCSPDSKLTLLGSGDEGVTFTDGTRAFKCMDFWQARTSTSNRKFLRSLVGAWTNTVSLLPILQFEERANEAVLVMPFKRGKTYRGGNGAGLVALLRECLDHGIVCRNMHPKNLLVADSNMHLVDYGVDLRPLDTEEWRHMVRRAWLSWRWATHPDLDKLMHRAIKEDPPEVDGWERLEQAVMAQNAKMELDTMILDAVLSSNSGKVAKEPRDLYNSTISKVLDFGCGSSALVEELANNGIKTVGYDPRQSRHWYAGLNATYTSNLSEVLANAPYDTVVCSLVLCTLDNTEYRKALLDLRACVKDGGGVVIAVCHPFHTHGGDTPFQHRIDVPDPATLEDNAVFSWTKQVRGSNKIRRDVHRPLHVLKRDLLRGGILVESMTETSTVDLARLEPASDFLLLRARAISSGPDVSLLIRASALEWRTLEIQVRHVVNQLEQQRAFRERLVALDRRTSEFTRAYDIADLDASRKVLERLVEDGTIDRFLEPPTDPNAICDLNDRWFGIDSTTTHTALGAPLVSTCAGFEACSSEYILHIDDDLMILRGNQTHDVLEELADVLTSDDCFVAASLNILHVADKSWTSEGPDGPWGVEVRGTLLHHARLLASRPWPNSEHDGVLELSWHRSFDHACELQKLKCLRGGQAAFGFVHPPNKTKRDCSVWLTILDRIEHGHAPDVQIGRVELEGDIDDWIGPLRPEPIVVIACGRNVSSGRVARFKSSIDAQTLDGFGLVVVEDGGTRTAADIVRHTFEHQSLTTLMTLPDRRGVLANLVMVVRHMLPNPDTVVVQVDLDDALLGSDVLAKVLTTFESGHDLAIGGMRRTDKAHCAQPSFYNPRANRGGDVWQHLRAFRRSLFDQIPDSVLRDDDGSYFDLGSDWALMIALAELSKLPCALDGTLYLHEPSGHGKHGLGREEREAIIGRILARPSLSQAVNQ